MKILDLVSGTPEENLALDEALVDALDEEGGEETLRFWESSAHFLVLGHGNHVAREVQLERCEKLRIPIFRRCSGGGAVLQGAGCFNYSLIVNIAESGPLAHITTTNRYIMARHREALERLLKRKVAVRGTTDLAIAADAREVVNPDSEAVRWLKFSGNAQRRKRRALLFHGSFLLRMDLELLGNVLAHPSQEPEYRDRRAHAEFVTNIPLVSADIRRALIESWQAGGPLENPPLERMRSLVTEKYSRQEWNFKF